MFVHVPWRSNTYKEAEGPFPWKYEWHQTVGLPAKTVTTTTMARDEVDYAEPGDVSEYIACFLANYMGGGSGPAMQQDQIKVWCPAAPLKRKRMLEDIAAGRERFVCIGFRLPQCRSVAGTIM